MSRVLSPSLIQQKNKLDTKNPWIVALDMVVNPDPNNFREEFVVNNNEELYWGSQLYQAAPFKLGTLPAKSSGELPQVNLTVFNTLKLAKLLNDYNGLIGNRVKASLVYATKDAQGVWYIGENKQDYPLTFYFNIAQCSIGRDAVSFTLGKPNYLKQQFPARLYHRDFCDFNYKGEYCWMRNYDYDDTDPDQAKLNNCNNTLKDCERHYKYFGLDYDETKIGIAYGGFPNIGKGAYVYR